MLVICPGTRPDGAPCANVLGLLTDGRWEIRHRGRRYWTDRITAVECEDCGTTTPAGQLIRRAIPAVA